MQRLIINYLLVLCRWPYKFWVRFPAQTTLKFYNFYTISKFIQVWSGGLWPRLVTTLPELRTAKRLRALVRCCVATIFTWPFQVSTIIASASSSLTIRRVYQLVISTWLQSTSTILYDRTKALVNLQCLQTHFCVLGWFNV